MARIVILGAGTGGTLAANRLQRVYREGDIDHVDIAAERVLTPLDAAFTKPVAAEHLTGLLNAKGIHLESEFSTGSVAGGLFT